MKHILYSLALLLLVSCAVQKRHYRKGFYIASTGQSAQKKSSESKESNITKQIFALPAVPSEPITQNGFTIETSKKKGVPTDSCDVLVFRDGTEILAKITELNESQVRYKRCDNVEGPTYVTEKSDLFMLKYSNGTREVMPAPPSRATVISPAPPKTPGTLRNQEAKYDEPSSANVSLIAGLTALLSLLLAVVYPLTLISSFLAAINAVSSAKKYFSITSKEPYLYPGRAKAITGLILGVLTFAVFAVLLLFLLVLILSI
jgi:hypothetical protein